MAIENQCFNVIQSQLYLGQSNTIKIAVKSKLAAYGYFYEKVNSYGIMKTGGFYTTSPDLHNGDVSSQFYY